MTLKKKHPSPKKPPTRKRRANIMLRSNHEASSFIITAKKAPPKKVPSRSVDTAITATIDIPTTPTLKAFKLRLNMTSYKSTTSLLRLNKPRSFTKQRSKPVTNFTLVFIQPSSPISSQLLNSLNNMSPPKLPDS